MASERADKKRDGGQRIRRRRAIRLALGCCGGGLALVIVCGAVLVYLVVARLSGMCQTTVYGRKPSPHGTYVATLYMVDCGAATNFNRQVALRRRKLPWWSHHRGDETWPGDPVLAVDGARDVTLTWTSPRDLTISVRDDPMARRHPLRYHTPWRDVRIRWVRRPENRPPR